MKTFILLLSAVLVVPTMRAQTSINIAAVEKQQHQLSTQVSILHTNVSRFRMLAYPNGAPFAARDGSAERQAAWNPQFDPPKDVPYLNDGLGCVIFPTASNAPEIPAICAPVDVRAKLAMEALREDWENSRNVPEREETKPLISFRNAIPLLWSEEKILFCVLRPEAQYIDLGDNLQKCTPEEE